MSHRFEHIGIDVITLFIFIVFSDYGFDFHLRLEFLDIAVGKHGKDSDAFGKLHEAGGERFVRVCLPFPRVGGLIP